MRCRGEVGVWVGGDGIYRARVEDKFVGEWGEHNQYGMTFVEIVFPACN